MTTETQKSELLEQFQNYLEQSNFEPFSSDEQPDLSTLLNELTSLKTEVKAESRQFKNTLDTLSSALTSVQDDNKALSTELTGYTKRLEQQQYEIMRTMLLDIVDIYDRLTEGVGILQNYRPVSSLFKRSRDKDVRFIKRFKEGQAMTTRRFEQLFQQYQVRTIDCVGKLLDPVTMSAVETGHDPTLDNGIVLEELRKGFLFQDQILRLAEVKVNKINTR
jgi:molecular chaperone GrpE